MYFRRAQKGPKQKVEQILQSSHIIPSFCLQVIKIRQLIKGLHHFAPPKYYMLFQEYLLK